MKKKDKKMVSVPVDWFEGLLRDTNRVNYHVQRADDKDFACICRFELPTLLGYCASAKTIIKKDEKEIKEYKKT